MAISCFRQAGAKAALTAGDLDVVAPRKVGLLQEQRGLLHQKTALTEDGEKLAGQRLRDVCELARSALPSYELGNPEERRDLVTELISNGTVNVKNAVAELSKCGAMRVHLWHLE